MAFESLTTYFQEAGFPESDADRIAGSFNPRPYRKGDLVLREGDTCRQLGLVDSGLFMFYMPVRGEERTTYVVGEGGFLASLWSFIGERPSAESIRCVRDGRVWLIEKADLLRLRDEVPGFADFYTAMLEREICCIEESRYDLIALTAEERYEKLLTQTPHVLQQIPLYFLAALLGITPRHLSRIRAGQSRRAKNSARNG
ncbi:cyclic nucleotide-binding domain-containing protein [Rudanella paleaurantiibacter]|uniref:Cyclic nucleotide-binding domain-containing protein n=1 Tax=Rudanella paleaurantiibacter TaxID=2614655 RepID=A0A7J5TU02_9BACT|nr:Crp/Fnr family transcriptional regulator [Rudanella paleaurantiibacter]KAB7727378.1 cyclic nucleotide-binding domain-containing protein [Rudanella paleaurantiibacter]